MKTVCHRILVIVAMLICSNIGYAQSNSNCQQESRLQLNCKRLKSFPDTIKGHYDYISLTNWREGFNVDKKCHLRKNTISDIPVSKLVNMDSTQLFVDTDIFHIESEALINSSLKGKVEINNYSWGIFSFNSLDSQNVFYHDAGYFHDTVEYLKIPSESDYYKLSADINPDKTFYILTYPYSVSGEHTITVILTFFNNGLCSVSELLVDFNDSPASISNGCMGVYKIHGKTVHLNMAYGVTFTLRLTKQNRILVLKRGYRKLCATVLSKRHVRFLKI